MSRIQIHPLRLEDAAGWRVLAEGYKRFYATTTTPAEYDEAWRRLLAGDGVFGFGAQLDGQLVGLVHALFHTSVWAREVCYLQDLFVADAARGRGVAAALIERVAEAARQRGAARLYWLTQQDNHRARRLYDRVAFHKGFIRYDHTLAAAER